MPCRPALQIFAALCIGWATVGTAAAATGEDSKPPEPIDAEGVVHVGVDFGWASATFVQGTSNGFGGGIHAAYGITDAFNLRVQGDVTAFDIPQPGLSALFYHAAVGAEYTIDVLRWVPYAGVLVGPTAVSYQSGPTVWHLGIDIPFGLAYRLSRNLSLGAEYRLRLLFLGDESTPGNNMLGVGRFEYMLPL